RTIAFASDRGIADLADLHFGDLQIYTMSASGGDIRALPLFTSGKQINPQFASDGSLYFIANPEGISEIFRYTPSSNALQRVTKGPTGVAGITELSPAMTVASRTGEVAFSVYANDEYYIYALPRDSGGEAVSTTLGSEVTRASLLPPELASAAATYTSYLQRPAEGLPSERTRFPTSGYDPDLHLTYLGPPMVGLGVDQSGFGVGGSLTAYFSDVLGKHTVGFTFQSGGGGRSFSDQLGGELVYLNQERRFNWGGVVTHIPYVSSRTGVGQRVIELNGQQVIADVIQQRRDVVTLDELSGISQYPLSTTRRVEVTGGWQRYGFKSEIEELIVVGDRIIDDNIRRLEAPESVSFFKGALAYVGDSSTFGFISPVRGTRYRFEIEALGGDLNFQTALADWRRYLFARPVTFAMRALHYGRYGDDAESVRLSTLQIGSLVRGYDIDDIDVAECGNFEATNRCPVFDRLIGSRLAVASAELRAPLFGPEGYGLIKTAILPTEIVAFADMGVAWTEDEDPEFKYDTKSPERVPAFSVGVAARILLAYIPIELYYAKPLQRPQEDWVFGFYIRPGW
ncbi:MAG TPA: BamA/TamA family outer membrane protein, partial [Thermoanaerobaculia bacterium]